MIFYTKTLPQSNSSNQQARRFEQSEKPKLGGLSEEKCVTVLRLYPILSLLAIGGRANLQTYRSAPAHDNILLIRRTWNGCTRTRMWNWSLPECFTMYLLAQIRLASRASLEICSISSDTRWMHNGNSEHGALFLPRSKIRILGSEAQAKKIGEVRALTSTAKPFTLRYLEHHGRNGISGMACFCSSGNCSKDKGSKIQYSKKLCREIHTKGRR